MANKPKLRTYVHLAIPDADGKPTGMTESFGPGDTVPDWAVPLITNPKAWEVAPTAATAPARQVRAESTATPGPAPTPPDISRTDGPKVPPRGGAGSGRDAWAAYAAAHGAEINDAATREDIIAALDEQGIPTAE